MAYKQNSISQIYITIFIIFSILESKKKSPVAHFSLFILCFFFSRFLVFCYFPFMQICDASTSTPINAEYQMNVVSRLFAWAIKTDVNVFFCHSASFWSKFAWNERQKKMPISIDWSLLIKQLLVLNIINVYIFSITDYGMAIPRAENDVSLYLTVSSVQMLRFFSASSRNDAAHLASVCL